MRLRIEPVSRTVRHIGPLHPTATELPGREAFHLHLTLEKQARSNWCWSAVARAIAGHYGDASWTQERIAWTMLATPPSEADRDPVPDLVAQESYNQQADLGRVLRRIGCLAGWSSGRPPFRRLMREVSDGRPLAATVGWRSGQQHYVLVDGFDRTRREISVADPQCGRSTAAFDDFPLNYRHGGAWTETYWTGHPPVADPRRRGDAQHEQL